jgi:metallo-beta-lactamase family protein
MRDDAVSLRFLGATGTVTGSRFLLAGRGTRVLVDCGLYQGQRELRRRNWQPFPVPAGDIDAVVLSHAHLDHCGYLPRLVREGFAGPVHCSPWTARIAPIVLRDAAYLQEEDARHAAAGGYSRHARPEPLFDAADAEKAVSLLRPTPFGTRTPVGPDATVLLRRAGHVLGSATVEVAVGGRVAGFSGDLGRSTHPLLNPPEPAPAADVLLVESTYGDRAHPPYRTDRLADLVGRALARGGVVLVPSFAIDRTEVMLMTLRRLMRAGRLPTVPVYVDSPMALAALEVYRSAVRAAGAGPREEIRAGVRAEASDPFDPGDLRLVPGAEESARLNDAASPCVILSASGMATGGRVVHHLASLAPRPENLILLPGFQVPGTRGRALLDGARSLKMFGRYVPVRAEVAAVDELSAHADADGLLAWLRTAPAAPQVCYVVHGEPAAAAALAGRISTELGWCAVLPGPGERVLV